MENYKSFSQKVTVFHDRRLPEPGLLAGYAALIRMYELTVPLPDVLSFVREKHKNYSTDDWKVFGPRYLPEDTLLGHITFAFKYEGVELLVLNRLFHKLHESEVHRAIDSEPNGQYSRRLWFLFEWLTGRKLQIPDLQFGNYVDLVDEALQYSSHNSVENSQRHRIRNNLPGVQAFCPMIRKTPLLEEYRTMELSERIEGIIEKIHPDVVARAAAFLLLKDSKASYAIEGEQPAYTRLVRWGRAVQRAGKFPISKEELSALQSIVIDNSKFTKMGYRQQEGFIGEHDRRTGTPIPEHVSARWKDVESLMAGLLATTEKLENDTEFDAVLATTMIAFGFVFIHPFVDGNGRVHRYLFHHVLARKNYVPAGVIFPISAIILERLDHYRIVLEAFSGPRLELIEWSPAIDNNIQIENETVDLYRYFDATKQAEFLYSCVRQTLEVTIPEEVDYLQKFDRFKRYIDDYIPMPDQTLSLLIRFLEQGNGKLSSRALKKEFALLTPKETEAIQKKYSEIFRPEIKTEQHE